jgi:hypothetical protein
MLYALAVLAVLCVAAVGAQEWEDTEITSSLWGACSRRDTRTLKSIIESDPTAAFARSADGRGPLFWAYEFGHVEAIDFLEALGVDNSEEDNAGNTPTKLGVENEELNKQREFPTYPDPMEDEEDEDEDDEDEDEDEDDEF